MDHGAEAAKQFEADRFEKSDVRVESASDECSECTEIMSDAGYYVMLDFRSAGTEIAFDGARYCKKCADKIAQRIKDGLPE